MEKNSRNCWRWKVEPNDGGRSFESMQNEEDVISLARERFGRKTLPFKCEDIIGSSAQKLSEFDKDCLSSGKKETKNAAHLTFQRFSLLTSEVLLRNLVT